MECILNSTDSKWHCTGFIQEEDRCLLSCYISNKHIQLYYVFLGFLGFLACIQTVRHLLHEMRTGQLDLSYLACYKMCQDHLEIFFNAVRYAKQRNKSIILKK